MPNRRNKRKNAKKPNNSTGVDTQSQQPSASASTVTDQSVTSSNLSSTDQISEVPVMTDTLRDTTNMDNNSTGLTAGGTDNANATAMDSGVSKPTTQYNSSTAPAHYEIPPAGPVGVGALGGTATGAAVTAAAVAETDGTMGVDNSQQSLPLSANVKHSIQNAIASRCIDTESIIRTISGNVQSGVYNEKPHTSTTATAAPTLPSGTTHKGNTALAGGVVGAAGAVGAAGIAANSANANENRGTMNTKETNVGSNAMGGANAFGTTSPINTTGPIHPTDTTNPPTGPNVAAAHDNTSNTNGFNPNASTSEGIINERRRSSGRSGRAPIPAELIGGTPNCAPPAVATNSSAVVGNDVEEGQAFDPVRRLSNGLTSAVSGAATTVTTGGRRLSETLQDKVLPRKGSRKESGELQAAAATTGGMSTAQHPTTNAPEVNGQTTTVTNGRSAEGGHNTSKKKNCIIL